MTNLDALGFRLTDEQIALLSTQEMQAYYSYLKVELERERTGAVDLEQDWRTWLKTLFPDYFPADFADHHEQFWRWVWNLRQGVQPDDALVAVFARGGAKSTSAEAAVVAAGGMRTRSYVLYICDSQDQSDEHVGNIGAMLESSRLAEFYPSLGQRRVGKYGNSRGWRRNRLVSNAGLVVDALGLDVAARGVKFDQDRPDLFVFDDLDSEDDTFATTEKKIDRITKKLLPAGAPHAAVLAIQNLVIPDGVFAQLVDGRAEFLARRIVIGPIPAVRGLVTQENPDAGPDESRYRIVEGEATWAGQSIETCQRQIDDWGLTAFLIEAQHEVGAPPGGMYDRVAFSHLDMNETELPDLIRTGVWVDPAVTDTDQSDSHAYCCSGLGSDGVIYRLESWEGRTSPEDSLRRAILCAHRHGARSVGVETDQGGDTWRSVFREACRALVEEGVLSEGDLPSFTEDKASRVKGEKKGTGTPSKAARGARMLADYERPGKIKHVVNHPDVPSDCTLANLERALRRFPRTKPFDLADAAFWDWRDLKSGGPATSNVRALTSRGPSTRGSALAGSRVRSYARR